MRVHDASEGLRPHGQPLQNVAVVDGERVPRMQRRIQVAAELIGRKRRLVAGRTEVDLPLPVYVSVEGDQSEISILKKIAGIVFGKISVLSEARKIRRPQRLVAVSVPDVDTRICFQVDEE